jgi:hypothetical protein
MLMADERLMADESIPDVVCMTGDKSGSAYLAPAVYLPLTSFMDAASSIVHVSLSFQTRKNQCRCCTLWLMSG